MYWINIIKILIFTWRFSVFQGRTEYLYGSIGKSRLVARKRYNNSPMQKKIKPKGTGNMVCWGNSREENLKRYNFSRDLNKMMRKEINGFKNGLYMLAD